MTFLPRCNATAPFERLDIETYGDGGRVEQGGGTAMHELAITQQVVDAVAEHADGAQVRAVHVDVGKLSGVVPDAMRFCFDLVTSGTCLEGAALHIDQPAGFGVCRTCGTTIALADLILLCECGSADVDVTSGRELTVRSYEVV